MAIAPGHVVAGKYRIVERLGRGGMGSVWLAEHLVLGSQVAIKVIDHQSDSEPESLRRRFLHEAKAAAQLRSSHVVQIFDYGIDEGIPFMVMERLVGETLGTRLAREHVLEPELVATIFAQIGRAVQKAHDSGIVHRDLKPENVFLVKDDDVVTAKVLDFGIAKALRQEPAHESTATGVLLGSPLYMSPEQAHGGKEVDHRSDLWSLAVIAFECMVGRVPFRGLGWGELVAQICRDRPPTPSTIHAVPEGFDAWFSRASERDPNRRFQSCRELVEGLRRVLVPAGGSLRFVSSIPPERAPSEVNHASSGDPTVNVREPFDETLEDHSGRNAGLRSLESTTGAVAASDRPAEKPRRKNLVALGVLGVVAVVVGFLWSLSRPNQTSLGLTSATSLPDPGVSLDAASQAGVVAPPSPQPVSASAEPALVAAGPTASAPRAAKAPPSARPKPRVISKVSPESSAPAPVPTPTASPSDVLRRRE